MQKKFVEKKIGEEEANAIRRRGMKELKYFNKVYVHVTAAAKMVSHAHFGIPREVMGLLQGKPNKIQDPTTSSEVMEYS